MDKILDFSGVENYFCLRHKRNHIRYKKGKKTKSFEQCKDFGYSLTDTEKFRKSFKRTWKNPSNSKEYRNHLII